MDAQNHLQNQQSVSQSHLCWSSLNMHMTFELSEIEKTMPRGLNINLRQSWGQTVVALVLFAVCIQPFWILQSSPESRFYRDLGTVDIKTVALDTSYKGTGTGQSRSVLRRWATRLQCCIFYPKSVCFSMQQHQYFLTEKSSLIWEIYEWSWSHEFSC